MGIIQFQQSNKRMRKALKGQVGAIIKNGSISDFWYLMLVFGWKLQQLKLRMPFIYRNPNRLSQNVAPLQLVKQQDISPLQEDSSLLSVDNNHPDENRQANEGRWNEDQNFKFVLFVHYYQDIFASRHKRKVCKIFRTFSQYLTERTPAQCRSHYQKMIIKHKSIAKLKKHYKVIYGEKLYSQEMEKFKQQWEESHPPAPKATAQIKNVKEIGIQTQKQPDNRVCLHCSGSRSESDLLIPTPSTYNPFPMWQDFSPINNSLPTNLYYWIPSIPTDWQ